MQMKKCNDCGQLKDFCYFSPQQGGRFGLKPDCKSCRGKKQKIFVQNNSEYCKTYAKQYSINNKEKLKLHGKKYRTLNKDKIKLQRQLYRKTPEAKAIKLAWHIENYKNNPKYKLAISLRNRLNKVINYKYRAGSVIQDLGCTVEFLKNYLESQFEPGMTWGNHTQDGWHIDHIKPLANFNLSNRQQFLEACNYKNLKPLWAIENLQKNQYETK